MDLEVQVKNNFSIKLMIKNIRIVCVFLALFFTQKVSSQQGDIFDDRTCLLYTSDAADDSLRVDLGGRRIIKKVELRLFLVGCNN